MLIFFFFSLAILHNFLFNNVIANSGHLCHYSINSSWTFAYGYYLCTTIYDLYINLLLSVTCFTFYITSGQQILHYLSMKFC